MKPDDEQEYHSNGEWPAIRPEDLSRPVQPELVSSSRGQPDLCDLCGCYAPAGRDLCPSCEAHEAFGGGA